MDIRRRGMWVGALAFAGACERCTWDLEYVPYETTAMSIGKDPAGGDSGSSPGSATTAIEGTSMSSGGAPVSSSGGDDTTSTGEVGTTATDGTGLAPAPYCGDGEVNPGEECDDGNLAMDDACPSGPGGCGAAAVCGDGIVWSGEEECDDGNTNDEDECSNDCWAPRRVFVTAKQYSGALGGVAGGDQVCKMESLESGLPGEFKAWLSESSLSLPLKIRFDSSDYRGWYVLVNGEPIARGWNGLTITPFLQRRIDVTSKGESLPTNVGDDYVWTNTEVNGSPSYDKDCAAWTGEHVDDNGRVGRYSSAVKWTSYTSRACSTLARLYCFQVG